MQLLLAQETDLRLLFLLLIRIYRPNTHSLSHLKCLVKLNHNFLMMTQQLTALDGRYNFFDLKDHVYKYEPITDVNIRNLSACTYIVHCTVMNGIVCFSFATPCIMRQYGHLLSNFRQCSPQTIEQVRLAAIEQRYQNMDVITRMWCCVCRLQAFTMMHHIAVDCGRIDVLLQLPILNAFVELEQCSFSLNLSKVCFT